MPLLLGLKFLKVSGKVYVVGWLIKAILTLVIAGLPMVRASTKLSRCVKPEYSDLFMLV